MIYDCVVIGAGIAGMTASIYLKRAGLNVLLLDKDAPGGLLNKIAKIENYPGFISISGPTLASNLYEQIKSLGISYKYGKVISIKDNIITTDIEKIEAKRVILAIGRNTKKDNDILNLSYCALCDANFYKDKTVALIGSNNEAINDAIYLSNIASVVYLFSSSILEGEEYLKDKLKNIKNVIIYENTKINKFEKEDNLVKKINTTSGVFEVDGVFVSMENIPDTDFLDKIEKSDKYVIVNSKMQTNIDYIYACGDIIKKDVYQLTTAVSEATIAAINVKKSLM